MQLGSIQYGHLYKPVRPLVVMGQATTEGYPASIYQDGEGPEGQPFILIYWEDYTYTHHATLEAAAQQAEADGYQVVWLRSSGGRRNP